jgi:hypothetical protein
MRALVSGERVRRFIEALGREAKGPGRVYLTGGSTAVLEGWRESTVDVDLKLDPEPPGAFEAIAHLKNDLDINVELAAPDQFVPPLPGWQGRSRFVGRFGEVDFFHYDLYSQALAKLERGHARDLDDVAHMVARGLVERAVLGELFESVRADLLRYPAIDPAHLAAVVAAFVAGRQEG